MSQHKNPRQLVVALMVGVAVLFSAAALLEPSKTTPAQSAAKPVAAPASAMAPASRSASLYGTGSSTPTTAKHKKGKTAKQMAQPSPAGEKMLDLSPQVEGSKTGRISTAMMTPEEIAAYQAAGYDPGFPANPNQAPRFWTKTSVVSTASPGDTVTFNVNMFRSHTYVKLDMTGFIVLFDVFATPIADIPWAEVYLPGHPELGGEPATAMQFQTNRYAWHGDVALASTSSDVTNTALADAPSSAPSVSSNGRYVAFVSAADNLATGDGNGSADVYVRDTTTNKIVRASLSNTGAEPNAACGSPSISTDGRYVAFTSVATNLTSQGGNGRIQIYVRDLQLQTTKVLSVDEVGALSAADCFGPSISGDGQDIAFDTTAHLVAGDTNGFSDIYVRDVGAGSTQCVSLSSSSGDSDGDSGNPAISQDGGHVAFLSAAKNLVSGAVGPGEQLFVRDLTTGAMQVVSVNNSGNNADSTCSGRPAISADGKRIAFVTDASNLAADLNGFNDVYLRDVSAGTTQRISVSTANDGWDGLSFDFHTGAPTISPDGRYVSFQSENPFLDCARSSQYEKGWGEDYFPDNNGVMDIFVRDTDPDNPSTIRASLRRNGSEISSPSSSASISNTARVAFVTDASGLMSDAPATADANGVADVYVSDFRLTKITVPVHFVLGPSSSYDGNTAEQWYSGQNLAVNSSYYGSLGPLATEQGVLNVSVAPVALSDQVEGEMATSIPVDLLANDVINNPITTVAFSRPAHGTVLWNSTSQLAYYRPDPSFIGTDTFTYKSSDGALWSPPATITAHVLGCVPSPDTTMTVRNTALVANVLDNDRYETTATVPVGDVVAPPAHGSAVYSNTTGKVTYTPNTNYVGADSFTYRLFDGFGWSAPVQVTVKVVGGTVSADSAVIPMDTATAIDVLANDAFVPTGTVPVGEISAAPSNGTAVWDAATGRVLYTPKTSFTGTDILSYRLFDGVSWTAPALVNVQVMPGNIAPVAVDDSALTDANAAVSIDVLGNDSDPNGGAISIVLDGKPPVHGAYSIGGGKVLYTPGLDFAGTDSFTYRVSDSGGLLSGYATVSITVRALNKPPVAKDDAFTVPEDQVGNFAVLVNDSDSETDTLTPSVVTAPAHGSATWNASTQCYDYTPNKDYNGSDSFTYRDFDGNDYSQTAVVSIIVDPVNDAPVARADSASTVKPTSVAVDVLHNDSDVDGDSLVPVIVTGPRNGKAAVLSGGGVRYTPDSGYVGSDSFTYHAFDGQLGSNTVTVTITVVSDGSGGSGGGSHGGTKKQVIRASNREVWTGFEKSVGIGLRSHVSDVLGRSLTVSIRTVPSHGEVTLNSNGVAIYVPDAGFSGVDSFTYRAADGGTYSNTARVTVHVGKLKADKQETETAQPTADADTPESPVEAATTPTLSPIANRGTSPAPSLGDKIMKWLEKNVTPCAVVGLLLFVVLVGVFFRLFARRQMRENEED